MVQGHDETLLASVDAYLEENAEMDPLHEDYKGATYSFEMDDERRSLLEKVNYKPDQMCDDVRSAYSAITGDGESSGASSLRDETSLGAAMGRTASIKMELAKAKAALADRDYEFKQMQQQLARLQSTAVGYSEDRRAGGIDLQKVDFSVDIGGKIDEEKHGMRTAAKSLQQHRLEAVLQANMPLQDRRCHESPK